MNPHAELQRRARSIIKGRKLRMKEVAHRSGLNQATVCAIINGRKTNATIGTVWALAGAIEVDPFWLIGHGEP